MRCHGVPRRFPLCLSLLLVACSGGGGGGGAEPDTPGAPADAAEVSSPDEVAGDDAAAGGPDTIDTVDTIRAPDVPELRRHIVFADRVLVIAHRGGGALAPENTIEAYRNAIAVGADMLEMDVHATSDGVLVVSHDDSVDRTTDGSGFISQMTFSELRRLDAGYRFSPDGGQSYPYRGQGVVVPTLAEVFDTFPDMYMTIEPKQTEPPIVDALLALIDEKDMADYVVLGTFDDAKLAAIRAARPELLTGFGAVEVVAFISLTEETEAAYEPPGIVLQLQDSATTPERIARAHRLGVKVHVWTVNDSSEMRRFIAMGADGIMTDDPATLRAVLD